MRDNERQWETVGDNERQWETVEDKKGSRAGDSERQ